MTPSPQFRRAVKEAARRRAYRIITDPLREEALARLRAEMERETGPTGALVTGRAEGTP